MLNFALLRHWENWLIVLFVAFVACQGANLVGRLVLTTDKE